ncbi:MAG TPA: hypothetical protein EYQ01_10395 [Nitrospira sp.]|nr:hypothetical protein [Candidatus Manganitrophaceae bacterium]
MRYICLFLFGVHSLLACVNTSYSRDEEIQITDNLAYLIIGRFPEHGEAFYTHNIPKYRKSLESDPNNTVIRNDLAVAVDDGLKTVENYRFEILSA